MRIQGSRRSRCRTHRATRVDDEKRWRRTTTPCRPSGYGGVAAAAVLPLLDDAMASPASRRLAATATALVTRPVRVFQQAPSDRLSSGRMRSDQDEASTVAALPIFPLTGMLLLPGTFMPLNVFEQRYRNMVQDVLRGDRLIGMIQPLVPAADNFGPVGAQSGVPDTYSVGCAGRIAEWERESDGRYLIVLDGERRFSVREELTLHRGYRRVRARLLSDHDTETGTASRVIAVLLGSALEYCRAHRIGIDADVLEALPGARLTNALAAALPFQPEEKQALLEASGIEDRASILLQLFEMSGVAIADSEGPVASGPN